MIDRLEAAIGRAEQTIVELREARRQLEEAGRLPHDLTQADQQISQEIPRTVRDEIRALRG